MTMGMPFGFPHRAWPHRYWGAAAVTLALVAFAVTAILAASQLETPAAQPVPPATGEVPADPTAGGAGRDEPDPARPRRDDEPGFALESGDDGEPVAWRACSTVTWAVDPTVPAHRLSVVRREVRRTLRAAGLAPRYVGVDDGVAVPERMRHGDPDLVVSVAPAGSLGETVAGRAQNQMVGDEIVLSTVHLDASVIDDGSFLPVLRHELGHVVGLDHVDDPDQLMYPVSHADSVRGFQSGDRAGLAVLAARPCP
jgi:hypothetical protein